MIQHTKNKLILHKNIIASSIAIAITFCILRWVLVYCRYGIDFTDEGYYLIWISDPDYYKFNHPITFFGNAYHQLYKFLSGDVAKIRQANVLITFTLASFMCFMLFKDLAVKISDQKFVLTAISTGMGSISLIYFSAGLSTPSYNSLNFQALILVTIGLALIKEKHEFCRIFSWVFFGIGGSLVFLAKPSSALAVALVSLGYLLFTGYGKWRFLLLSVTLSFSLLLIFAITIDGSLIEFIDRINNSIRNQEIIGAGHDVLSIFRLDRYTFTYNEIFVIVFCYVFLHISIVLIKSKHYIYSSICIVVFGAAILGVGLAGFKEILNISGMVLLATPFVAIFICIFNVNNKYEIANIKRSIFVSVFLFLMPYVYAFGTNNNYLLQGSFVGLFWVLSGLVVIGAIKRKEGLTWLFPVIFVFQVISLILLDKGIESPYRQPQSLRHNSASYNLRNEGELLLSVEFNRYLLSATSLANSAGFSPGTPIIDLSGNSPGVLYAMSAKVIGQPWINGGYVGSDQLAIVSLNTASCNDLADAWILEEPVGPMKLSSSVLNAYGASRETDFEIVGSFTTPIHTGGYKDAYMQNILKPTRSHNKSLNECLNIREADKPKPK